MKRFLIFTFTCLLMLIVSTTASFAGVVHFVSNVTLQNAYACTTASFAGVVPDFSNVFNDISTYLTADNIIATFAIVPLAVYVKNNCSLGAEELEALKKKYGKIKILSVVIEPPTYDKDGKITNAGEVYNYAVRRPDVGHVRMLMDSAKKGDIDKYVDIAIKNLIVGGDMEALRNDGLVYMGVTSQLEELLKPYQSFLANA